MLRILVVEDSASQREALIELLRERYWIRGVGGAREAEAVLHAWPADVVLLDLVLGAAYGVELLDALRRARADVHIIVTSGIAMIEPRLEGEWLDHERELRAAGADDFIPKPLELERLMQALDRIAYERSEHADRPDHVEGDSNLPPARRPGQRGARDEGARRWDRSDRG